MATHSSVHAPTQDFDINIAIENIAHWLPTQGPIKDFIHHNTLHAVQYLPFHQGVAAAAKVFGARSYLPLADYQQRYQQGRIPEFAIDWAIEQTHGTTEQARTVRQQLFIEDQCIHYPPMSLANQGIRTHWLNYLEVDLNSLVHPILFRLLGNFLDQGISRWTLPKEGERFWDCVWRLARNSLIPLYPFNEPSVSELLELSPNEVILFCLQHLVGDSTLYEQYLLEMLLAHPGWAGMVRLVELNPAALLKQRTISLKEMIALELAVELAIVRKKKGINFIPVARVPEVEQRPLLNDEIVNAQIPLVLKVWHEAMEFALHAELLIALQTPVIAPTTQVETSTQAIFCIDDRECSLRRYLEEIDPSIDTFGAAGFFGIDFFYQGFDNAYPVAQCPNIITPKHLVRESTLQQAPDASAVDDLSNLHVKSHSLLHSWLFTQILGISYALRMAWAVFKPSSTLLKIEKLSAVDAHTQLHLLRESDEPNAAGQLLGFSFSEMADKIEGLLRIIGLTTQFAPLVVIVAHGSSSTNNPHFAAYDCGACSGKPGAPNARAFAWMANHETVRQILKERAIIIPSSTRFIAALHNTSRDEITYFDNYLLETHPATGLLAFQQTMRQALDKNALERCRWFELAPKTNSADYNEAHQHVIARASSIFEPRPELNHSNNLYCVIGRRAFSHDLFMDRRAFLHSYNWQTDPEAILIVKILTAIIPVCGGINLEYLFSRIDNAIYGAGTKLPHNVIGLLGVANGVDGDLRTGLPSQMIEVHEPARLLIVIEQSCDILNKAFTKLGNELMEWLNNDWIRLACCHPISREQFLYHATGWEAINLNNRQSPRATDSISIIQGQDKTIAVHSLLKESA